MSEMNHRHRDRFVSAPALRLFHASPKWGLFGASSHVQNSGVNPSRNIPGSYFPRWVVCGPPEAMHVGMTASVKVHHGASR
jgi:hypothetical protein